MPLYEYEHLEEPCSRGRVFEYHQKASSGPLIECPWCGGPIKRLVSPARLRKHKTDTELRDLGFTKLVRKDDGIFENVTARNGESKIVDRRRPETLPHLHKIIKD